MTTIKQMSAKDFREQGFLRELNRLFLHPLGLALEVVVEDDGTERFGEVWDYRHEPEGLAFEDSMVAGDKARDQADAIEQLRLSKEAARKALFGWIIQPIADGE